MECINVSGDFEAIPYTQMTQTLLPTDDGVQHQMSLTWNKKKKTFGNVSKKKNVEKEEKPS